MSGNDEWVGTMICGVAGVAIGSVVYLLSHGANNNGSSSTTPSGRHKLDSTTSPRTPAEQTLVTEGNKNDESSSSTTVVTTEGNKNDESSPTTTTTEQKAASKKSDAANKEEKPLCSEIWNFCKQRVDEFYKPAPPPVRVTRTKLKRFYNHCHYKDEKAYSKLLKQSSELLMDSRLNGASVEEEEEEHLDPSVTIPKFDMLLRSFRQCMNQKNSSPGVEERCWELYGKPMKTFSTYYDRY